MIKVICGRKGSGKTRRIVDLANKTALEAKGCVAFLDDDNRFMYELRREIRFINYNDFGIRNSAVLEGVIIGLLAGNHDMESIFVDGIVRVVPEKMSELEEFFTQLEKISDNTSSEIIFTISLDEAELPEFIKKYVF